MKTPKKKKPAKSKTPIADVSAAIKDFKQHLEFFTHPTVSKIANEMLDGLVAVRLHRIIERHFKFTTYSAAKDPGCLATVTVGMLCDGCGKFHNTHYGKN